MRELSLQEVVTIGAAAGTASFIEAEVPAIVKWGTSALTAWHAGNWGATLYPYAVGGLDVGKLGLGGAAGAAGGAIGMLAGKLINMGLEKVHTLI